MVQKDYCSQGSKEIGHCERTRSKPDSKTKNRSKERFFAALSYLRAIEESNLGQRIWRPQLYHLTNRPWSD